MELAGAPGSTPGAHPSTWKAIGGPHSKPSGPKMMVSPTQSQTFPLAATADRPISITNHIAEVIQPRPTPVK